MISYMNGIKLPQFRSQIPFTLNSYVVLIDPPAVLYTKGDQQFLPKRLKIAIIGSRKATVYSKKALSLIVPPLVENEAVIVSGLQKEQIRWRMKQQSNMEEKRLLYSDMAYFILYPKENEALAKKSQKNNLLLTEYPPYVKPERWTFPMRNRIISGLSDAVVVTEAADKSGTMSTVEHALDHGKDIFAVPGPITSMSISRTQ